jgi:hypothetical protein
MEARIKKQLADTRSCGMIVCYECIKHIAMDRLRMEIMGNATTRETLRANYKGTEPSASDTLPDEALAWAVRSLLLCENTQSTHTSTGITSDTLRITRCLHHAPNLTPANSLDTPLIVPPQDLLAVPSGASSLTDTSMPDRPDSAATAPTSTSNTIYVLDKNSIIVLQLQVVQSLSPMSTIPSLCEAVAHQSGFIYISPQRIWHEVQYILHQTKNDDSIWKDTTLTSITRLDIIRDLKTSFIGPLALRFMARTIARQIEVFDQSDVVPTIDKPLQSLRSAYGCKTWLPPIRIFTDNSTGSTYFKAMQQVEHTTTLSGDTSNLENCGLMEWQFPWHCCPGCATWGLDHQQIDCPLRTLHMGHDKIRETHRIFQLYKRKK